jgi:hypothetical protein
MAGINSSGFDERTLSLVARWWSNGSEGRWRQGAWVLHQSDHQPFAPNEVRRSWVVEGEDNRYVCIEESSTLIAGYYAILQDDVEQAGPVVVSSERDVVLKALLVECGTDYRQRVGLPRLSLRHPQNQPRKGFEVLHQDAFFRVAWEERGVEKSALLRGFGRDKAFTYYAKETASDIIRSMERENGSPLFQDLHGG